MGAPLPGGVWGGWRGPRGRRDQVFSAQPPQLLDDEAEVICLFSPGSGLSENGTTADLQ